jgi:hypothetical protein
MPVSSESRDERCRIIVKGASIMEKTTSIDVRTAVASKLIRASESVDSIRKGINGISIIERLSSKDLEEKSITGQRRTVVNVLIGLDDPDELLNRVVKVQLDLVGRRTNRLITSELELGNQILMRVLGHSAAFISVKEDIVNIQRSGNQRLVIGDGGRNRASNNVLVLGLPRISVAVQCGDSPQALINRTNIKVNLDLVVLESDQRKSKSRVGAEPELKRNVKGNLRKSVTRSTNLTRSQGVTRRFNIRERRISDEGKLGNITNHLKVSTLLLGSHGKLVPDVHPVTILAVNALASNLDLNLSDKLLSRVVQPTGIDTSSLSDGVVSETHKLVDLRKSDLEIGAVSKISVSADGTLDAASKISLAVECLFD